MGSHGGQVIIYIYKGNTASLVSGKPNAALFPPEIFRTLTIIGHYIRKTTLNKKNNIRK